jgi:hypothetical protein
MNASSAPEPSQPGARRLGAASRLAWLIVAGIAVGVLVWGFFRGSAEREGEAERERPVEAPLRVATVAGEPTITLSQDELARADIELATLEETQFTAQLSAYGTVLDSGSLVQLSSSYAATLAELQKTRARLKASQSAAERAQRLYDDQQNTSLANLQAAQAAFAVDQANVAAGEVAVENLISAARQAWGVELGRALVERTPKFLQLLEMEEVLVQVTLPPNASLAEPPQQATARIAGRTIATVRYLSRAARTDPRIQGLSYFYTGPAGAALLPGMSVTVLLDAGQTVSGAVVPADAVVWMQGRAWAYFRRGEGTFARREVPVSQPVAAGYFVAGLTGGTEIVRQGAQLLLSEEFRSQIQVGEE